MYLDANYDVLWKFSDDFASCSGACTHVAEYQAVGDSEWKLYRRYRQCGQRICLRNAAGREPAECNDLCLPVFGDRLRFSDNTVGTYYFRVAITDAPPVITSGPFVAAGTWPALATIGVKRSCADQNENVLWTFSDDYASCAGLCTHRARYRLVGDTAWTWITVSADPTGKKYAYTELPVEGLAAGTYHFWFDVRDCAGQNRSSEDLLF